MRRSLVRVASACCLFLRLTTAAASAHAEDAPLDEDAADDREWYGWQTLSADALATSLVVAGLHARSDDLFGTGVASYFLLAPGVHWVHGNVLKGFGSLALHLAVPFATLMVQHIPPCGEGREQIDCPTWERPGPLIGWMLVAAGTDAAFLAWDRPSKPAKSPAPSGPSISGGLWPAQRALWLQVSLSL